MGFFIETRSLGIGLIVGAAAGGAATVICIRRDLIPAHILGTRKPAVVVAEKPPERTVPPLKATFKHPALKYGAPTSGVGIQNLRIFDEFVVAFDSRTRNPSWVLEHLSSKKSSTENVDRSKSFFSEDEEIDERFRTKLDDFQNSGYDRGHLAAAANHRTSQKAMDETFKLTNVSPQVGVGFNRDYWARLEKFTRDLIKVGAAVFVATGPLWLPEREGAGKYTMRYPMIGTPPALISVPTHFYKVILVEPADLEGKTDDEETSLGDSNCAVAAFVMPNRFIPEETPLTRFAVPISDLEVATGLTFFPKFMTERKRMQLDTAAHVWRSVGRSLQGKTKSPSLETLDGGSKEPSRLQNNILRIPRSELNSITQKRCSADPHLCYHTDCTLPPPGFWKKEKSTSEPNNS